MNEHKLYNAVPESSILHQASSRFRGGFNRQLDRTDRLRPCFQQITYIHTGVWIPYCLSMQLFLFFTDPIPEKTIWSYLLHSGEISIGSSVRRSNICCVTIFFGAKSASLGWFNTAKRDLSIRLSHVAILLSQRRPIQIHSFYEYCC